jgi:PKD repeat protein
MLRLATALLLAAGLAAQSPLQSTFVGGLQISNPGPAAATQLFDITVTDPAGLTIHRIDTNINTGSGTNGTLGVWITGVGGTLLGNELNAAAWTNVATATRTHTGGRTTWTLPTPFYLAPGTYGMALHHVSANPVYTNPVTPVPPLPSTYSTLEASLNMVAARVRTSTVASPFGGTGLGNLRHPNIALYYVSGVTYCDFAGTPIRGASPLTVNFTSFASSGNPGGIAAYAWDFDGDGVVDSNLPNPSFTYVNCGNFNVSLTIIDSVGPTTAAKTNYVQTDIVVPSFTNQLIAPNTVQFTDTSSPAAQTWDWDLDGDGLTDSTVQNPTFTYTNSCSEVNVTLRVQRACQPTVTLSKRIAVASTLETVFTGGTFISATAPGGASFMDVNVTNPNGVTICGLHVHSSVAAGSPVTVNFWQKAGTYVGAVIDATQWRLVGTSTTTSRGFNQRTFAPLAAPVHLAAGLNGVAVELVGGSPYYSNLGAATTYSNADMAITTGLVQLSPIFGPAATSTQFTPRVWNGAFHYGTTQTNGAPGYGYIGAGCAGTLGVPGNTSTTQPSLGGAATITVDKLPFGIAVLAVGVSRTLSGIGPLPVDLGLIGMPGCPLRVSFEATLTMIGAGTSASLSFPIPSTAALVGTQLYTQALSLDPALNAFGFSIGDAAVMLVGQ